MTDPEQVEWEEWVERLFHVPIVVAAYPSCSETRRAYGSLAVALRAAQYLIEREAINEIADEEGCHEVFAAAFPPPDVKECTGE